MTETMFIEVSDDGKGIDSSNILKSCRHRSNWQGTIKKPKEHEITSFLFEPGFSTTSKVTDVSGRGWP